jgi:hypothetical protein
MPRITICHDYGPEHCLQAITSILSTLNANYDRVEEGEVVHIDYDKALDKVLTNESVVKPLHTVKLSDVNASSDYELLSLTRHIVDEQERRLKLQGK